MNTVPVASALAASLREYYHKLRARRRAMEVAVSAETVDKLTRELLAMVDRNILAKAALIVSQSCGRFVSPEEGSKLLWLVRRISIYEDTFLLECFDRRRNLMDARQLLH